MCSSPTARGPNTFEVWSKDSHMFCTECEDTSATLLCLGCEEEYCQLCWESLHRRGVRAKHVTRPLNSTLVAGAIAGVGDARLAPEAGANGSSDEGENVVGSSDETGTKRPRAAVTERSRARPDGHEGPLCPSGYYFSKPVRDPSVSPSAPKRAKLVESPRVEVAPLPASSDSSASERKTLPERKVKGRDYSKGREERPRSPNPGDKQLGEVTENQTSPSPREAAKAVSPRVEVALMPASSDSSASERNTSPEGKKREKRPRSHDPGDQQLGKVAKNQISSSPGEAVKAVSPRIEVALLPASSDSSASERKTSPEREKKDRDNSKGSEKRPRSPYPGDQQLGKIAKSITSSSPGEAAKAVSPGVEVATLPASSDSSAEEDVGPARVPTAIEKALLASISRRSYNVPLRLDAREREILGVLAGALHQINYTDEVDRIMLKGTRLESVVKNLKRFFASIWGLFTVSGVKATTMRVTLPPHQQPPRHGNSNGRQGGASLTGLGAHPFGKGNAWQFLRGSSSAGGAPGGNGNGLVTPGGSGAKAADAAASKGKGCGADWYRADSFSLQKGSMGLTKEWASAVRTCCEIGRRHKILNPEKMRGSHGMLMYVLMDAQHPLVKPVTGFSCIRAMRTVRGLSESSNLLGLFDDPDLILAIISILPWDLRHFLRRPAKDAGQIAIETKEKAKARKRLLARHGKGGLEKEVSLVIDSLADSIVGRDMATRPIRRMLALLRANWTPVVDGTKNFASLAIRFGQHGSRLTHEHATQYLFVLQSLHLWLQVVDNMLDLWAAGDRDLLNDGSRYNLKNTGQGLQRVQAAPKVGQIMQQFQRHVVEKTKKPWVGSPVVHLGDNCVPNALVFLDKYCQVSPILNAIIQVIDYLDDLDEGKDPPLMEFIKTRWQTVEGAKRHILHDFFRSGFDGSGANNTYDAGSCVDGRLTSVWNWCSKLEKKDFYHLFMCSGFRGFNGDFS